MIDFRYHLVSIVAVFLALAIGIVLGTAALNGPVLDNVRSEVKQLRAERQTQRQQLDELKSSDDRQAAFIAGTEASLEKGVLDGQRVALIAAPGTSADTRSNVLTALNRAGAVAAANVRLTPAFVDPDQADALDALAARLQVPAVAPPSPAPDGQLAVAELAAVLVNKPGRHAPSPEVVQRMLAGYQRAGFLSVAGNPDGVAPVALLLVPGPTGAAQDTQLANAVVALATRLADLGTGVVVAGPVASSQPGGALAAVRADPSSGQSASTVDTVDKAAGRVAAVMALREAADGGAGDYGFGPGATAPLATASPHPRSS